MPEIAGGMDAKEIWHKYRTPIIIGAGGLVFFLMMRGRGQGAPVAATAPAIDQGATSMAAPAAAQPDMSQGAQNVSALQDRMQQEALREQTAAFNLSVLGQQQQLAFQGQQNALQAQLGAEALHQQQEVTYGLYKANRPKGAGGLLGFFQRSTGITPQAAKEYTQAASSAADLYTKIGGG